MMKVCANCQTLYTRTPSGDTGRCPSCAATRQANQPTTTQKGLGSKWKRLSASIIERDGGVCQIRRPGCLGRAITADHIIARSRGGTDDEENLRAACRPCNSGRGAGNRPHIA
jgi:5-methylcytosine-specific restriction endonuclease McrA